MLRTQPCGCFSSDWSNNHWLSSRSGGQLAASHHQPDSWSISMLVGCVSGLKWLIRNNREEELRLWPRKKHVQIKKLQKMFLITMVVGGCQCVVTQKKQHKQFRVLADKTTQPVSSSSDSDELNSKRGLVGKYKFDEWIWNEPPSG